jgi:signal transduction histidine kinase
MTNQFGNALFCFLDGLTPQEISQQRLVLLRRWDLITGSTPPIFEEATQTLGSFLKAPIAILTLLLEEELLIKSAVGLSQLGLRSELAVTCKLPEQESYCIHVIGSQKNLAIVDTLTDDFFSRSILAQNYGIRSYLGTPLITSEGYCIGTLAVMDFVPRTFAAQELTFINLTARWCLAEFERDYVLKNSPRLNQEIPTQEISPQISQESQESPENTDSSPNSLNYIYQNQMRLIRYLTNDLVNFLTSIIGMSSILLRQVYGNLNQKQKEYLQIIYNSGQSLTYLVDKINNLGFLDDKITQVSLLLVNIEMLCQQVIGRLNQIEKNKQCTINLSMVPGSRLFLLDKEKCLQTLYYLFFTIIDFVPPGGELRIHVSNKNNSLSISTWIEHPYLGGIIYNSGEYDEFLHKIYSQPQEGSGRILMENLMILLEQSQKNNGGNDRVSEQDLSKIFQLLYSCQLAEIQGGEIVIQGTANGDYRYVLNLPQRQG